MKNIKLKIFLIILLVIFTPFLGISEISAQSPDCSKLAGQNSPHAYDSSGYLRNPEARYTGNECRPPGQLLDVSCIGGCRYLVKWCVSLGFDVGCEETYPEQDCSKAPAACNKPDTVSQTEIGKIFGRIAPPHAIENFGFGSIGISNFLSNLVALIFSLAMIVFVFMLLWGAFDWIMSEGEKEKIASARSKIINAIIGIILFAIAFAVIRLIGVFTGFTFFK